MAPPPSRYAGGIAETPGVTARPGVAIVPAITGVAVPLLSSDILGAVATLVAGDCAGVAGEG